MKDSEILAILTFITLAAAVMTYFESKKISKAYEQRQFLEIIKNQYGF